MNKNAYVNEIKTVWTWSVCYGSKAFKSEKEFLMIMSLRQETQVTVTSMVATLMV